MGDGVEGFSFPNTTFLYPDTVPGASSVVVNGTANEVFSSPFGVEYQFLLNGDSGTPFDLLGDGPTPNDVDDMDNGPNGLLNYPVLGGTTPSSDGENWIIPFEIDVDQPGLYAIRIFALRQIGNSEFGEYVSVFGEGFFELETLTIGGADFSDTLEVPMSLLAPDEQIAFQLTRLREVVNAADRRTSSELSPPFSFLQEADFDRDGDVDGNDFLLWQQGVSNRDPTLGDANGDGLVNGEDLVIWSEQYNGPSIADFTGDGDVDGEDLTAWTQSFGVDGGADADGDGDSDGFDFLLLQREIGIQQNDTSWTETFALFVSPEAAVIFVTSTADGDDGNYGLGELSLREAVRIANDLPTPVNIILPTGRYTLDQVGSESNDGSYNDLDINGDITISGDGPGLSIIDSSGLSIASNQLYNRAFHVDGVGNSLVLDGVTVTGGDSGAALSGTAVLVQDQASLEIIDSAIVNNSGAGDGVAIRSQGADVVVRRSVFTNNTSTAQDAALFATKLTSYGGSVTIGQSIFALNQADSGTVTPNVWVANGVARISEGYNLYDEESGNFFNQVAQSTDYLGTTGYIVTTIEDTFDHANNNESLSVREAIDLANNDSGASKVCLPAWHFELTRDRGTNATDTDVSYGDLDITDSLVVRGISSASGAATNIAWRSGVTDAIFDLLGDFTGDGIASPDDGDVDGGDFFIWQQQNGSTGGIFSADADDDGDVDNDDLDIWSQYHGNTLDLFDIAV